MRKDNSILCVTTNDGCKYYMDTINKTISGGKLGNYPQLYLNNPALFEGGNINIDLENGRFFVSPQIVNVGYEKINTFDRSQSNITEKYGTNYGVYNNAYNGLDIVNSGAVKCTTDTGKEYLIDLDNMLVTGGFYQNKMVDITLRPQYIEVNKPLSIATEYGIIKIKSVEKIEPINSLSKPKQLVAKTRNSAYVIDLENRTVTGGYFRDKTVRYFANLDLAEGKQLYFYTNIADKPIVTSPIEKTYNSVEEYLQEVQKENSYMER